MVLVVAFIFSTLDGDDRVEIGFPFNPIERFSLLSQAQPSKDVIIPGSIKAAQHLI